MAAQAPDSSDGAFWPKGHSRLICQQLTGAAKAAEVGADGASSATDSLNGTPFSPLSYDSEQFLLDDGHVAENEEWDTGSFVDDSIGSHSFCSGGFDAGLSQEAVGSKMHHCSLPPTKPSSPVMSPHQPTTDRDTTYCPSPYAHIQQPSVPSGVLFDSVFGFGMKAPTSVLTPPPSAFSGDSWTQKGVRSWYRSQGPVYGTEVRELEQMIEEQNADLRFYKHKLERVASGCVPDGGNCVGANYPEPGASAAGEDASMASELEFLKQCFLAGTWTRDEQYKAIGIVSFLQAKSGHQTVCPSEGPAGYGSPPSKNIPVAVAAALAEIDQKLVYVSAQIAELHDKQNFEKPTVSNHMDHQARNEIDKLQERVAIAEIAANRWRTWNVEPEGQLHRLNIRYELLGQGHGSLLAELQAVKIGFSQNQEAIKSKVAEAAVRYEELAKEVNQIRQQLAVRVTDLEDQLVQSSQKATALALQISGCRVAQEEMVVCIRDHKAELAALDDRTKDAVSAWNETQAREKEAFGGMKQDYATFMEKVGAELRAQKKSQEAIKDDSKAAMGSLFQKHIETVIQPLANDLKEAKTKSAASASATAELKRELSVLRLTTTSLENEVERAKWRVTTLEQEMLDGTNEKRFIDTELEVDDLSKRVAKSTNERLRKQQSRLVEAEKDKCYHPADSNLEDVNDKPAKAADCDEDLLHRIGELEKRCKALEARKSTNAVPLPSTNFAPLLSTNYASSPPSIYAPPRPTNYAPPRPTHYVPPASVWQERNK